MRTLTRKPIIIVVAVFMAVLLAGLAVAIILTRPTTAPQANEPSKSSAADPPKAVVSAPVEDYKGQEELVTDTFTVKVPNGWQASIADTGTFRAIMFARPEQLTSLNYSAESAPVVDRNGIPAWNGLTEHFFILAPTTSGAFKPTDHREITSESFTFADGTPGTKYNVIKHAEEAVKYGGLLRENEWQGRTYIYEKNDKRVEAHLALYPSSTIDKSFFESVVKSIKAI